VRGRVPAVRQKEGRRTDVSDGRGRRYPYHAPPGARRTAQSPGLTA